MELQCHHNIGTEEARSLDWSQANRAAQNRKAYRKIIISTPLVEEVWDK